MSTTRNANDNERVLQMTTRTSAYDNAVECEWRCGGMQMTMTRRADDNVRECA